MRMTPMAIHSSEGTRVGDPNWGRYRLPSASTTGTRSAPSIGPRLLPTPPTIRAVKRTKVSPYSHEDGAQAWGNGKRMDPPPPAVGPPPPNTKSPRPRTVLAGGAA